MLMNFSGDTDLPETLPTWRDYDVVQDATERLREARQLVETVKQKRKDLLVECATLEDEVHNENRAASARAEAELLRTRRKVDATEDQLAEAQIALADAEDAREAAYKEAAADMKGKAETYAAQILEECLPALRKYDAAREKAERVKDWATHLNRLLRGRGVRISHKLRPYRPFGSHRVPDLDKPGAERTLRRLEERLEELKETA